MADKALHQESHHVVQAKDILRKKVSKPKVPETFRRETAPERILVAEL